MKYSLGMLVVLNKNKGLSFQLLLKKYICWFELPLLHVVLKLLPIFDSIKQKIE